MNQGIPSLGWYSRQGYFSKFVVAFVSVVILVLAINDIVEAWFVKRQTTDVASKSLSDNAQAAAQRVEQYTSAIERQISWATRASTRPLNSAAPILHCCSNRYPRSIG